jgi:hypothetical protein
MLKLLLVVVERECVRSGKKRIYLKHGMECPSRICRCFGNDGMYLEKLMKSLVISKFSYW